MCRFLFEETGAVTVDWVVMTAAVVGLGLASAAAVRTGTGNLGADINTSLTNAWVAGAPVNLFDFNDVTGLIPVWYGAVARNSYQGWTAVGTQQHIEVVNTGVRNIHTPDGGRWIDIDSGLALVRPLENLPDGATYTLSFNAAHSNPGQGGSVNVFFGGQLVDTITPTSNQFSNFTMDFIAGSGDGTNQLEFRGTGTTYGNGVSLHGIQVR